MKMTRQRTRKHMYIYTHWDWIKEGNTRTGQTKPNTRQVRRGKQEKNKAAETQEAHKVNTGKKKSITTTNKFFKFFGSGIK